MKTERLTIKDDDLKNNQWLYEVFKDSPMWIKFIDKMGNIYGPIKCKITKP